MELRLGGYFPKRVVAVPEWIHAPGVADVCSVSTCISPGPANWIDHWLHLASGLELAVVMAQRFSLEQPEPGPYYVVEVLERSSS